MRRTRLALELEGKGLEHGIDEDEADMDEIPK